MDLLTVIFYQRSKIHLWCGVALAATYVSYLLPPSPSPSPYPGGIAPLNAMEFFVRYRDPYTSELVTEYFPSRRHAILEADALGRLGIEAEVIERTR